jgi:hypothetical protein
MFMKPMVVLRVWSISTPILQPRTHNQRRVPAADHNWGLDNEAHEYYVSFRKTSLSPPSHACIHAQCLILDHHYLPGDYAQIFLYLFNQRRSIVLSVQTILYTWPACMESTNFHKTVLFVGWYLSEKELYLKSFTSVFSKAPFGLQ